MKITPALIQQFLENRCTAAEAKAVARYLKKYPELMAVYLRSSWEEAGTENHLPANYADEMWNAIDAQMRKEKRVIRFRFLAVAASLLLLIIANWLLRPATKTSPVAAGNIAWKQQVNTTNAILPITLPDGSVVKLAPKAVIKYLEPRNIYMQGEADFEVAHDSLHPFTVHSKFFATTALGTSFKVSETALGCTIKLFTGKVVIRGGKETVYLLPGQQMNYSLATRRMAVESFNKIRPVEKSTVTIDEGNLVFDNSPLPAVMRALTKKYNTPILYNERLLRKKYFSGEVLQGDSLSTLLQVIANMNDFQVAQQDGGYIISKAN